MISGEKGQNIYLRTDVTHSIIERIGRFVRTSGRTGPALLKEARI